MKQASEAQRLTLKLVAKGQGWAAHSKSLEACIGRGWVELSKSTDREGRQRMKLTAAGKRALLHDPRLDNGR